MGRLFKIDGVYGVANKDLTCDIAFKLGQAAALVLTAKSDSMPFALIGRDTRISGHMLESALIAGICSVGVNAQSVGIIPTPSVAYLVKKYKMTFGVVISESEMTTEYNGIRFFDSEGRKISDDTEKMIEEYIAANKTDSFLKTGADIGKVSRTHTALRDYVDYVKLFFGSDLSGMKVAIDCANGATFECAKLCFKELGADVEMMNNIPNGININDNCGLSHMEGVIKTVTRSRCSFGLAMDGDGCNILACDEKGKIIDNDMISKICSEFFKGNGNFNDGLATAVCLARAYKEVGTPMSNLAGKYR